MPRRPGKPKRRIPAPAAAYQDATEKEQLYDIAVKMYLKEQDAANNPQMGSVGYKPCGLQKIAERVEQLHYEKTNNRIHLLFATLGHRVKGGRSRCNTMADRMWLSPAEKQTVVKFILEMAGCSFLLSHRCLREHVNAICRSKYPKEVFPQSGVGQNWTYRFLLCHYDELRFARSSPLETKCGKAVTPEANEAWWKLLKGVLKEYNIKPHNIYGADKCGIMNRGAERERLFGPWDQQGPVYQSKGGNCDNTTVLVTICADGTYTAPTIIFKGKAVQTSWLNQAEGVLKPNVGYQVKGWTTKEIGVAWMEIFDKETKTKLSSPNKYRLLLVDGHNSHHTVVFLEYAWNPTSLSSATFLTLSLGKNRDFYLFQKGIEMSCKNFIEIFSGPFMETLTPDLIKTAFRKTGVHPFDPSQIDSSKLAPSTETDRAQRTTLLSPIPLPTDIDSIATLLDSLTINKTTPNVASGSNSSNLQCVQQPSSSPSSPLSPSSPAATPEPSTSTSTNNLIQSTINTIQTTDMAYLFDQSATVNASHPLPPQVGLTDLPTTSTFHPFSGTFIPTTSKGAALLAAICTCKDQLQDSNRRLLELHASNLLNHKYAVRLHDRLEEVEKQQKQKGKGNMRFTVKGATVLTHKAVIEE
ncbi:hypothetical protein CVT24_002378, partial [Panaeolus cyanescens]